ncbi:hypothetical protein BCV72DRAFT_237333 [Rhizopus microsporus var. microsporus]|uniref:C2H2-type domain-containing protein n=1 Tax=Rhizopus microsporus var. microsporus TaxID=86635 RepID=A0A1X0QM71_RHIZD|nr:hypothetical protein BCV72DRAFT_237333 [Rhizopus microsporus var. microsporus]
MNTEIRCQLCDELLPKSKDAQRNHERDHHIDSVYVGESRISILRTNGNFTCPSCGVEMKATRAFGVHLKRHGLIMATSKKRGQLYLGDAEGNSKHDVTDGDSMLNHSPSPTLALEISTNSRKIKKPPTCTETVLLASDSLMSSSQAQQDKLMLAQLGRWMPIIYRCKEKDHGFLTSISTASTMLQDNPPVGEWLFPDPDTPSNQLSIQTNEDTLIRRIKSASKAAKILSTTNHVELTEAECKILNQDWLEYPQLRYCCSQLLAGCIMTQDEVSILVNTIEPYARDSLIDAHFERRSTSSPSSFPTTPGRYGFLTVCLLPTNDGQKLVIGTRTSNFLVTSSIRLDRQSVNIGPVTTHFRPTTSTKIFLDCLSIELAKSLLDNTKINRAQSLPSLYQLKQVRSKFDCLSTYTMCRSSSTMASPLKLQPTTIWTLVDQDSNHTTMSQEKVGSLLFRTIALQVIRHGRSATLHLDDFKPIQALSKDSSAVASILHNICSLFDNQKEIKIIGNSALNSQLVDLANGISNKKENDKKIEDIIMELYD